MAFDAAVQSTGRRLHLSRFLSFGSQAAFFHVLAPRHGIAAYSAGQPVTLPPSIGQWTNLWHPLDMLAFAAATVFRLHDGKPPRDVRVDTPASEIVDRVGWLHSCYWESAALLAAVREP